VIIYFACIYGRKKSWKSDPFVFDFCFLQNIEQGKIYKVVLYVRSLGSINVSVSLTSSDGLQILATANIVWAPLECILQWMVSLWPGVCVFHAFLFCRDSDVSNWTKTEVLLEAKGTNPNSRLQLTTSRKGVIWFDQVSAMPLETYKVFLFISTSHQKE
jgi:alpha-N-arabinofuranosidase